MAAAAAAAAAADSAIRNTNCSRPSRWIEGAAVTRTNVADAVAGELFGELFGAAVDQSYWLVDAVVVAAAIRSGTVAADAAVVVVADADAVAVAIRSGTVAAAVASAVLAAEPGTGMAGVGAFLDRKIVGVVVEGAAEGIVPLSSDRFPWEGLAGREPMSCFGNGCVSIVGDIGYCRRCSHSEMDLHHRLRSDGYHNWGGGGCCCRASSVDRIARIHHCCCGHDHDHGHEICHDDRLHGDLVS